MCGHLSVEGLTFLVEKVSKGMDVGVGNVWSCHVCWVESLHGCHNEMQKPNWVGSSILGGSGSTWRGVQDLLSPFILWDMVG